MKLLREEVQACAVCDDICWRFEEAGRVCLAWPNVPEEFERRRVFVVMIHSSELTPRVQFQECCEELLLINAPGCICCLSKL